MELYDLVKAIYLKQMVPSDHPALRTARDIVRDILKHEGPGLSTAPENHQLLRAFQRRTSMRASRQSYTIEELHHALLDNILGGKSFPECDRQYGVLRNTLKRHIASICIILDQKY